MYGILYVFAKYEVFCKNRILKYEKFINTSMIKKYFCKVLYEQKLY